MQADGGEDHGQRAGKHDPALHRLDDLGHIAVAGVEIAMGIGDADDGPVQRIVGIAGGLDEGLAQEQREFRIAIAGEIFLQAARDHDSSRDFAAPKVAEAARLSMRERGWRSRFVRGSLPSRSGRADGQDKLRLSNGSVFSPVTAVSAEARLMLGSRDGRTVAVPLGRMDMAETEAVEGARTGRARGGRQARQAQRSGAGGAPIVIPGVHRAIPTYDLMSEEGLQRIEAAVDTLLQEVGLDFRGDDRCLELWREAGADVQGERVRFEPGLVAEPAEDRARQLHPSRPQSRPLGQDRRQRSGLLARLWLALRPRHRQGPALRLARGFPEFRQARLCLALDASLRRHGLRARRRAGEQAPYGHGLFPYPLFRQTLHGLGDGGGAGRGFHRDGQARLRR